MNAREQQARSDAPNSAPENCAGSLECIEAVNCALKAHFGEPKNALTSVVAYHIQRLDELQQKHPEFYDAEEVAWREVAREILLRMITS